jgi:alpha-glucosidase (family GH31 glycosyl hydrolase)
MRRYDWCSFTWDPEAFPDPKKYLSDIKKEYNVKVCAWINPYISEWPVTVTAALTVTVTPDCCLPLASSCF